MTGLLLAWVACGIGGMLGQVLAMDRHEIERFEGVSVPMLLLLALVSALLGPVMLLLAFDVE